MRSRAVLVLSAIVVLGQIAYVHAQSTSAALSASDVAVACAPSLAPTAAPAGGLRIAGAQNSEPRSLFGLRDLVVVSGGAREGVQLDQEYFIRRTYRFGRYSSKGPHTIHTTGWLRIVAVSDTTAVAQLEKVCDGVVTGDYLEPFVAPAAPAGGERSGTAGTLDFSLLGRVLFGDEERRIAGPRDFMLLERGQAPVEPGTRVALYRDLGTPTVPLAAVGEGVIVSIANGTPVMRIIAVRDAIQSGDYVVPHK